MGGVGAPNNNSLLDRLNGDVSLNATNLLNNFLHEDENISQFFVTNISTSYSDPESFKNCFKNCNKPLILSLNIQSLNSKFSDLKNFILELQSNNISIDAIILQETWQIKFIDLLTLPGFQPLVLKNRSNMRGGGVGVYVKKGLNFSIKHELENFTQKTFENLVLELNYPAKSFIISNIYHSPNPPKNCTLMAHNDGFLEILDNHLNVLCNLNKEVYVFLDSNIDLLKLNSLDLANDYLNTALSNGFIQLICKATRVQGTHYS